MSRKRFWNWLGLPSASDLNLLSAEMNKQNEQIADLKRANFELVEKLNKIENGISESTQTLHTQEMDAIAGLSQGQDVLRQSCTEFAHVLLERIDSLANGQDAAWNRLISEFQKTENQVSALEQVYTKLARQLDELKSDLISSIESLRSQEENDSKKLVENQNALQQSCVDTSHMLLEKANTTAADIFTAIDRIQALNKQLQACYDMGKDTLAQVIQEANRQDELLKILIVNVLSDDIVKQLEQNSR